MTALENARARVNMPRIGKSLAREMDRDIIAMRDLIEYAETLERERDVLIGQRDKAEAIASDRGRELDALEGHDPDGDLALRMVAGAMTQLDVSLEQHRGDGLAADLAAAVVRADRAEADNRRLLEQRVNLTSDEAIAEASYALSRYIGFHPLSWDGPTAARAAVQAALTAGEAS